MAQIWKAQFDRRNGEWGVVALVPYSYVVNAPGRRDHGTRFYGSAGDYVGGGPARETAEAWAKEMNAKDGYRQEVRP